MTVHRKVDVVTVGAGWTGGIMAQQLTHAGLRVVSLEQGPSRWTYPDYQHNHDHLAHVKRYRLMVDLAKQTWTWRPNPQAPALPIRHFGSFHPGAGIGGAGTHWAGQTWRFLPADFRYRSHHIERYGAQKLPEGSTIQDWPLSYEELEPFYDRFEYDIGLSGRAGNVNGELLEGGNIFEGPRRRPFPLPPLPVSIPADIFADACTQLGYHPFPMPSGILSEAYTDPFGNRRSGCILCGFCTRFGCEVDAKSSAITGHIPAALATGRYEIRTECHVVRINLNNSGMATGVTYVDGAGQEHEQPADIVILCAFTLENVRLLLLSRHSTHPGGIGNNRGMVGKNYTYQISKAPVSGLFEGRRFNLFMGNGCTQNVIYDFYGDNFDHSDVDFIGGGRIMCGGGERAPLTSADSLPFLGDEPEEPGQGTGTEGDASGENGGPRNWGRDWKEALRRDWDSFVPISMEGDSLPYIDQYLDLDPTYRDAWGQPLLRITFDFHQNEYNLYRFIATRSREIMQEMGATKISSQIELEPYNIYEYQSTHTNGGAIMGSDAGSSVTNKYGQVWDTPNVFVTGAALFPQNPGANPTGTVCGLAYFGAYGIKEKYVKEPGRLISA